MIASPAPKARPAPNGGSPGRNLADFSRVVSAAIAAAPHLFSSVRMTGTAGRGDDMELRPGWLAREAIFKLGARDPEDAVQEAVLRALLPPDVTDDFYIRWPDDKKHRRRWRKDVPAPTFLRGVVRSLVSHGREDKAGILDLPKIEPLGLGPPNQDGPGVPRIMTSKNPWKASAWFDFKAACTDDRFCVFERRHGVCHCGGYHHDSSRFAKRVDQMGRTGEETPEDDYTGEELETVGFQTGEQLLCYHEELCALCLWPEEARIYRLEVRSGAPIAHWNFIIWLTGRPVGAPRDRWAGHWRDSNHPVRDIALLLGERQQTTRDRFSILGGLYK